MSLFPLVSIICPAFNAAETLRECVESVREQSYKNFEMIIVNDGSTDKTESVANDLSNLDQRIKVISQPNNGSCVARNKGFSAATGKYVSAIDADDLWPPWKLEEQVRILELNPESIVIGGVRRFGIEKGQWVWYRKTFPFSYETKEKYLRKLINIDVNSMVLLNTFCAPKKFIIEEGWDPAIKTGHDWEVWIRLAKRHPFITVKKIYQYYRKSNTSITRKNSIKIVVESRIIVTERHGFEILGSDVGVKRLISKRLLSLAQISYDNNNISEAWYCLGKALKYRQIFYNKEFYKLFLKNILRGINVK